jgi:hypothetical protein
VGQKIRYRMVESFLFFISNFRYFRDFSFTFVWERHEFPKTLYLMWAVLCPKMLVVGNRASVQLA